MKDPIHEAINARDLSVALGLTDVAGERIRFGSLVQYAVDREPPWTTERWGIVTGIKAKHIRVSRVDAGDVLWENSEWFAEPHNLRVLPVSA